jgi:hypothetical protein
MELEELKQKWDILSKEVEKQKIINQKLMDNVVNQKLKGLISYNWFGLALSILVIPFVYYLGKSSGLHAVSQYRSYQPSSWLSRSSRVIDRPVRQVCLQNMGLGCQM